MLIPIANALNNISETELETVIPELVKASKIVKKEFPQLIAIANTSGSLLSQTTFTR